ncbi:hypothetical protein P5V15_001543 [Pogonomyrmex californicus]
MEKKMNSQKVKTKGKNKKKFLVKKVIRPDPSNLRKPIDTSVSDLYQVSGLLEKGTDEVKSVLSYECNIIYECRTCCSLYRSIVNFISHKREYCKEKFDITRSLCKRGLWNNNNFHSSRDSIIHIYKTEETGDENVKNDRILRSQVPKETNKKDLSAIIDKIKKRWYGESRMENLLKDQNTISSTSNNQHIHLESINTNHSAVYQTVKSLDEADTMNLMKEQIEELHNITDQSAVMLTLDEQMSESQFEKSDSPIMDMSDEENELLIHRLAANNLSCTICKAKFSTKKTLAVHMKTLHTAQRVCYLCPDCKNPFANPWSVYRHLNKIHKKTNEQIRKLRPQVQEKAFHKETTAMKENVRATKIAVLENVIKNYDKTQESSTESNTTHQNRGRRGRKRKAPLPTCSALSNSYYQRPIAACDETTIRIKRFNNLPNKLLSSTSDNTSNEVEDVNLVTDTELLDNKNISDKNSEHISSSPEICDYQTFIPEQELSFNNEEWTLLKNQFNYVSKNNSMDNNNDPITSSAQNIDNNGSLSLSGDSDNSVYKKISESPDTHTDTNEASFVALKIKNNIEEELSYHNEKQSIDLKERDMIEAEKDNFESSSEEFLCSIQSNERSGTSLMENKIASIANYRKLRCLLCKRKFTSVPNLRRHIAMHIGWNRYRCKLCDYKCFVRCDCVTHCNKVHNMQNRTLIAGMIIEIPQDEYTCNDDIIMDANTRKKTDNSNSSVFEYSSSSNTHVTLQDKDTATSVQVAESHGSTKDQSVDAGGNDESIKTQNLLECMMNNGSDKLDTNPELKRIVMEVIFGSDTSATKQTNTDTKNSVSESTDGTDNVNNTMSVNEFKETSCSILNNVKYQRPTRNRIKPIMTYRKESALHNDSETLHSRKKSDYIIDNLGLLTYS